MSIEHLYNPVILTSTQMSGNYISCHRPEDNTLIKHLRERLEGHEQPIPDLDKQYHAVIGRLDNERTYFGVYGRADALLGKDHPALKEKLRPDSVCFVGYSADLKGAPHPRDGHIADLFERAKKDMETLLPKALEQPAQHYEPKPVKMTFSHEAPVKTNPWNSVSEALEEGRPLSGSRPVSADSGLRPWNEVLSSIEHATVTKVERAATGAASSSKGLSPGGKWAIGIAAAVAVTAGGWALYEQKRRKEGQSKQIDHDR